PCLICARPEQPAGAAQRFGATTGAPGSTTYYSLLLEHDGRMVVGGAGLFMVFSLLSGAVLWWPSRSRMASSLMPRLRRDTCAASTISTFWAGCTAGCCLRQWA
ncbi:MAG: PepSY domain-containing protein, partial [Burkholderiaceae bacterium]|nr:PepSY domain-containing protein [Burkholderiaceae bacterium]